MLKFSQWLETITIPTNIQKLSNFLQSVDFDLNRFENEVGELIHSGSEQRQIMWFNFLKNTIKELESVKGTEFSREIENHFVDNSGEIISVYNLLRTLKWIIRDNF